MSNELAVVTSFDLTAVNDSVQLMDALREELGADYRPNFAFAKTPSSARTAWDIMVSEDDPDPESAKFIEGVILHAHKNYAWWERKLEEGGNAQPDCSSMDGVNGMTADSEIHDCASCPYNQFGSDPDGKGGKACKNGRRIYILREGDMLPIRIDLAPTGNKPYEKYVDNLLLPRKRGQKPMRPIQVVTRVGLKVETNRSGIKYSCPTFECTGVVPDDARVPLMNMAESLKSSIVNARFSPVNDDQLPPELCVPLDD